MPSKEYTFDELPTVDEITLEVDYTYSCTPGRYFGAPENCYPEESEGVITLCTGWEEKIFAAYLEAARQCIKGMQDKISDLEWQDMPRKWAEEEARHQSYDLAA